MVNISPATPKRGKRNPSILYFSPCNDPRTSIAETDWEKTQPLRNPPLRRLPRVCALKRKCGNYCQSPIPEAVPHPNHFLGHQIGSELNEVGDVMDVELRADEEIATDVNLHGHAAVDIQMIGAGGVLAVTGIAQ